MSYRTMNEWNARGRQVKKGEKSMGRLNDNTPLFGKEQTRKASSKTHNPFWGDSPHSWSGTNWDWDEVYGMGYYIGMPGQE